jgi:hypothetical protein
LVLNHNDFTLLSSGVAQLVSLEVLELEDNRLNVLPWQVGSMSNLKVLKLDGNPLSKVPPDVARSKGNLQIWQRYLVGLKARMDESYRYGCHAARARSWDVSAHDACVTG